MVIVDGVHSLPVRMPRVRLVLSALMAAAACVVVGLAVAIQPVAVLALVVVALGALVAVQRPDALAFAAVVLLAVVPVYWAPKAGFLELDPSVVACWGAAAAGLLAILVGRASFRATPLDWAIAAYLGLFALPVLFGVRRHGEYLHLAFGLLGPYLAMRLLVPRLPVEWLGRGFAVAALLALPTAVYERLTFSNPFFRLSLNGAEYQTWADEQVRFGLLRAEGAFGHAISLSLFSANAMLFALGWFVLARTPRSRWRWLAVFVAGGISLALSYSRTGWVAFGVGVALVALGVTTGRVRLRLLGSLVGAVAAAFAALSALGLGASLLQLVSDDRLSASNNFRQILLERALRGEGLALFGLERSSLGSGIDTTGASIDNAYLDVAASWGYVGGAALVLVGLTVAATLWRIRGSRWALLPAVTLANFAGLAVAAIITQIGIFLWMLVGASAGAYAAYMAAGRDEDRAGVGLSRADRRPARLG
jgi:hypothetical protein